MSTVALLDQIERERLVWAQLLRAVGEERMEQPGASDAWTFQDVVAHLNGWRRRTLARLDAARTGAEPVAPWPADLDADSEVGLTQINAWIAQSGRERTLQEVLREARRSFDLMRDAVPARSEAELTDPSRYPWMRGEALGAVIGYAFGHFHEEHEPALTAWLDRIGRIA
jgi:hypothetical protein